MSDSNYRQRCNQSDVVMFYRCYFEQTEFIKSLCSQKKLVIYDIDDYVFQKNGKFNTDLERSAIYKYLENVNCYSAATDVLLSQMPQNNKPRFVRVNSIDQKTLQILSTEVKTNKKVNFRVGWPSGVNRKEMQYFVKQVLTILERKNIKMDFWYFGKVDHFYNYCMKFRNVKVRRLSYVSTSRWKDLYKTFKMCDFDVVINPLEEQDIFFHCKSHLKAIEWGAARVPLITSRVSPFTEIIQDSNNGFLATTPMEFVEKIIYIKNNKMAANNVRFAAFENVKNNYMIETNWKEFINNCSVAMDKIKKNQTGFVKKNEYILDVNQEMAGYVTNFVLEPIVQSFKCGYPGLCRIEFLSNIEKIVDNFPLKIIIKKKINNEVIFQRVYNAKDLKHHEWWGIEFVPVVGSKDQDFSVTILPLQITDREQSFKLYMHVFNENKFGEMQIDGKEQIGCLAYKTYCSKYITKTPIRQKETISEFDNTKVTFFPAANVSTQLKVLIKRTGSISSALNLTPAIKHLKQTVPNSYIVVATNHQGVFRNNQYIDEVVGINTTVAGAGKKIDIDSLKISKSVHDVDFVSRAILGHDDIDKTIVLDYSKEDVAAVDEILKSNRMLDKEFVVFHQGVSNKNITWPAEKWGRLEAHCAAQGRQIIVVGFGKDFSPKMPKTINLINKLTVNQSKYLLEKSVGIVCIDSDFLQIASSTSIPIFTIFTATLPNYRWPYRNNQLGWGCYEIIPSIQCFGCWHNQINHNYHGCTRGDFSCMDYITPKNILSRISIL